MNSFLRLGFCHDIPTGMNTGSTKTV